MRGLSPGVVAVACLSVSVGFAQAAGRDFQPRGPHHAVRSQTPSDGSAYYIVRMKDAPAATYMGEVRGYAATSARVRHEATLDVKAASSYAAYLDARQSALLESGARLLGRTLKARFRYHYALDGMSLKLTAVEAQRMASLPGVVAVTPVRHFAPAVAMPAAAGDTNASRAWIGSPAVWQLSSNGTDDEGEGVVLADLDTGINDANSSFAATGTLDGYVAQDGGTGLRFGVCDPNNTKQHALSTPLVCNDKLIGAYSYTHGANDPNSPEDSEGHGSHTASTAVGDFTTTTVNGSSVSLSGVAPHASLIVYDVCDPTNLCGEDDSVAAVEQAIKDQATLKHSWGTAFKGMVLNYSIGGSNDSPYDDPVEMAFLSAEEAGIYVSAAGGNGGPSNIVANDPTNSPVYPVQHLGPWVATLAAATHDGRFSSNLLESFTGGDSATRPAASMKGAGDTAGFGPQPLVYAADFSSAESGSCGAEPSGEGCTSAGSAAANAQQCLFPFNSGTFTTSEIVVCDRGTNPLVDKAYNVMKGGAAGMVIASTSTSSQDMVVEPYVIPATLLKQSDGDKLRKWLHDSAGSVTPPSAQISGAHLTIDRSAADEVAGFSSRGPNGNAYDAVIKPDLMAPGVSVLAAVGDPQYADGCSGSCSAAPESFDFFDGTSMATPHDSGAAALLKQAHPSWTPSEIKSALMLTAVTGDNGISPGLTDQCASLDSGDNCLAGEALPSPQTRGAGRIDVDAAERAGIVLEETGTHYEAANPAKGGDLTTLNLASLGNTACAATCTWSRTVTSTFTVAKVTYKIGVEGLTDGMQVSVSPASLTLAPGQSEMLTITVDTSGIAAGDWAFGTVKLTASGGGDGGVSIPAMHMPVAVRSTGATSGSSGGGTGNTGDGSGGGGGGNVGLFSLAALISAFFRRKVS